MLTDVLYMTANHLPPLTLLISRNKRYLALEIKHTGSLLGWQTSTSGSCQIYASFWHLNVCSLLVKPLMLSGSGTRGWLSDISNSVAQGLGWDTEVHGLQVDCFDISIVKWFRNIGKCFKTTERPRPLSQRSGRRQAGLSNTMAPVLHECL